MSDNTIYILDSYGLIYRAYFALVNHPLTNFQGENISALYIFFKNLKSLLAKEKPAFLAAAFDSRTKTFRHELYPEYKANRSKTPEDLHTQVPWIEEILNALKVPVLRVDGFEADDIIATVAKKCKAEGRECRILSGDKDLVQLVDETCKEMIPDKSNGGWQTNGKEEIFAKWGIYPEKILDYLSLVGDASDNVPGVKGVGDKTAIKLLSEYKTLDGIYEHAQEIKGALGEKIRNDKENAYFSKKLITLDENVPIKIDFNDFKTDDLDYEQAAKILKKYGASQIAKSFASEAGISLDEINLKNNSDSFDSSTKTKNSTSLGNSKNQENSLQKNPQNQENIGNVNLSKPLISLGEGDGKPKLKKNQGNYKALTNLSELKTFIDKIFESKEKIVAFDTETDSLNTQNANLVGFSLSFEKGKAIYVPVILPGDIFASTVQIISKEDSLKELKRLFDSSEITIIMHNGKFDLEVLATNGMNLDKTSSKNAELGGELSTENSLFSNETNSLSKNSSSELKLSAKTSATKKSANKNTTIAPKCKIFDTMIAAWLLNPSQEGKGVFSLENLGEKLLGLKGIEFNEIVPKGKTFADLELNLAYPYAAEDADFTFQIYEILKDKIEEAKLHKLFYEMEMQILPILASMEQCGIHLNKNALQIYNQELNQKISEKEKQIYAAVGHEFNIASTKQLQTVLFEERGLKTSKKTKTGYSTDTLVLEELAESTNDIVPQLILDYRSYTKLQSTYVESLPQLADSFGQVHTSFLQTGTATGRLSSRDPNLQNIPVRDENGRRIRSAFTANQGKIFISADYSQIELVVLAHLSGDKNLSQAFLDGIDVHKATAALIAGIKPEDVSPEQRRAAKTVNFGVMYGMSAFGLAKDLGISRTQAKDFIDQYFKTYSGVKDFISQTILNAQKNGYVETFLGRRRYVPEINSSNKLVQNSAQRICINTPIQGSAADIVKKAMIDIFNSILESDLNGKLKMLLQVHDELIFECDDDEKTLKKAINLIREKMENAVKLNVPLRVSIESGKSWGEFH